MCVLRVHFTGRWSGVRCGIDGSNVFFVFVCALIFLFQLLLKCEGLYGWTNDHPGNGIQLLIHSAIMEHVLLCKFDNVTVSNE